MVKITSGFSILIRQHAQFNAGELKRALSCTLAPFFPAQGGGRGAWIIYSMYKAGFRTPNVLRAGYKTSTHLDNSEKPDTKTV